MCPTIVEKKKSQDSSVDSQDIKYINIYKNIISILLTPLASKKRLNDPQAEQQSMVELAKEIEPSFLSNQVLFFRFQAFMYFAKAMYSLGPEAYDNYITALAELMHYKKQGLPLIIGLSVSALQKFVSTLVSTDQVVKLMSKLGNDNLYEYQVKMWYFPNFKENTETIKRMTELAKSNNVTKIISEFEDRAPTLLSYTMKVSGVEYVNIILNKAEQTTVGHMIPEPIVIDAQDTNNKIYFFVQVLSKQEVFHSPTEKFNIVYNAESTNKMNQIEEEVIKNQKAPEALKTLFGKENREKVKTMYLAETKSVTAPA